MKTAMTQEIPRDHWRQYFEDLGKNYQGWPVTVQILDRTLGDQRAVDGSPFQGLSFETVGSQAGDILVETGDAATPFESHLIHRPRVLRTTSSQPGAELDIEIETEEGVTNLISIVPRPELPPKGTA